MFTNAKTIVSVFGLDIRIDPSWFLIAALITWSLYAHVFPPSLPDQSATAYLLMAITAMLLFFFSLLLHELAHAMTGRLYGVNTRTITLFLFGGVAEMVEEPKRARDEFWIAIAGPAMSFALACAFWLLAIVATLVTAPDTIVEIFRYLAMINLILAVFNLLPAFPLDGGRVLRAWLWHRGGDILTATETASRVASLLAYTLMGLGALSLFQGGFVGGLWQILLGIFILTAGQGSVESLRVQKLLGNKTVADLLTQPAIVTNPERTLAELVNQVMLPRRISFVPVVDEGVLLGYIDSVILAAIDRENWASTQVGDVYVGLGADTAIELDLPVTDLFARIARTGQRKFMVIKGQKLVGVITLADLARYMALMKDIGRIAGRTRLHAAE